MSLRLDGRAVAQLLNAGRDDPIACLHAAEHDVLVADEFSDLDGTLTRDESLVRLLGDKAEIESVDSDDGGNRDRQTRFAAPHDSGARELLRTHRRWRITKHALDEHR